MSMSLMILVAAAAAQAGDAGWAQARNAYSTCLRQFTNASIEARKAAEAFAAELPTQCSAQATAYREAHVRRELQYGGNRQRAAADAEDQIRETQQRFTETFTASRGD